MINQIIYNTKPQAYPMQLTFIKDQLAVEATRIAKDGTHVKEVYNSSSQ
jgi:hypothetical protein